MSAPKKRPTPLTWTIKITVDPVWIQDGFNPSDEYAKNAIMRAFFGYARWDEVEVKVLPPHADKINAIIEGEDLS